MMYACRINVLNCGILDTEGHTQDLLTIGHSKRLSHRKYIVGIFTKVMNYTKPEMQHFYQPNRNNPIHLFAHLNITQNICFSQKYKIFAPPVENRGPS